ncbi:MAG: exodeoxyribonuclease V subunit alpha [Phycisphaeraceae bacterium]|nr:exodeoxyribonuclease V subunit alpha [Phycisphaeraceae bacterium]
MKRSLRSRRDTLGPMGESGRATASGPAERLLRVAQRGPDGPAIDSLGARGASALRRLLSEVHAALGRGATLLAEEDFKHVADGDGVDGREPPSWWSEGFAAAEALARAATDRDNDPSAALRLIVRAEAGEPCEAPYVLRGDAGSRRLATGRCADDERRLAREILERVNGTRVESAVAASSSQASSSQASSQASSSPLAGLDERQTKAIECAAHARLLLVTGGPGTGKTRTIARIVAQVLQQARGGHAPRIQVMAPTGRAAARLREQLAVEVAAAGTERASLSVSTIHAALRWRPQPGAPFEHTALNPMPIDMAIVDECSMVDLSLMRRLVEATPKGASLILVGDSEQLASVEAGSVFADLCAAPRLAAATVHLTQNYRTKGDPRAAWLASVVSAVRDGDADRAIEALRSGGALIEPGAGEGHRPRTLTDLVVERAGPLYAKLCEQGERGAAEALASLRRFRVLAATRRGDGGVNAIAARLDAKLCDDRVGTGRHIIVLENDREASLSNGDMGVVTREGVVVGLDDRGAPRMVPPASLPAHEPAWAISIHKSQGSEFDRVMVVLPADATSPILSRQLFYTALTRSRGEVEVVATEASLRRAVEVPIRRQSGLSDVLAKG